MINNLLSHPLMLKYFGYKPGEIIPCDNPQTFSVAERMAYNILQAMQEPIREGERFLRWNNLYEYTDEIFKDDIPLPGFHPFFFRLPSQFQKREPVQCKHGEVCHCFHCSVCKKNGDTWWSYNHRCQPSPVDPVECQVRKIWVSCGYEDGIKQLVALVRKERE